MSNTQAVVVYTPVQDALYNGGMLIPLIGGLCAGLVVMLLLAWIAGKMSRSWRGPNGLVVGLCCVVSLVAGGAVFHWLTI